MFRREYSRKVSTMQEMFETMKQLLEDYDIPYEVIDGKFIIDQGFGWISIPNADTVEIMTDGAELGKMLSVMADFCDKFEFNEDFATGGDLILLSRCKSMEEKLTDAVKTVLQYEKDFQGEVIVLIVKPDNQQ